MESTMTVSNASHGRRLRRLSASFLLFCSAYTVSSKRRSSGSSVFAGSFLLREWTSIPNREEETEIFGFPFLMPCRSSTACAPDESISV